MPRDVPIFFWHPLPNLQPLKVSCCSSLDILLCYSRREVRNAIANQCQFCDFFSDKRESPNLVRTLRSSLLLGFFKFCKWLKRVHVAQCSKERDEHDFKVALGIKTNRFCILVKEMQFKSHISFHINPTNTLPCKMSWYTREYSLTHRYGSRGWTR